MMKFTIPGRLDGLNQITNANRANRYLGARKKKDNEQIISSAILAHKLKPIKEPVYLEFFWVEPNKRRDMDNIASAKKMILDALVECGILQDDGWKYIKGFSDTFDIDKDNPRVEVTIITAKGSVKKSE